MKQNTKDGIKLAAWGCFIAAIVLSPWIAGAIVIVHFVWKFW